MAAFRNALIIGASGTIGSVILKAFEEDGSFNLTVLQHSSSKSQLPAHLKVITIADSYPTADFVAAFKGQDVFRLVDAPVAAGVRRYIPSEYGLNNARADAQALNPIFREKGKLQEYLRAWAADGEIEWMSISCGMWLRWGMAHDFLGMHVKERRFVFWDDGEGYFSCTTEENTAAGIVRALRSPEETKNRNVFLGDFAGVKYKTEKIDSGAFIKQKHEAIRQGDRTAKFSLIETGFVMGKFGGHLEKEPGEIMNEKLGLPAKKLDEVVANALKSVGAL
ncbi:NmrA-like family protein [Whalleya microplaca]|nr:NmrA-like family protein [Whalleya microplaca]